SPEQVARKGVCISTDVFSLGVVLYELLTGRVPFQGTAFEVLTQVACEPIPPPSRFRDGRRPSLSPALEAVCLKAVAKSPADRYATMAKFATALETLAGRRSRRRLLPIALAAAACVLVFSAVLVLFPRLGKRPEIQKPVDGQPKGPVELPPTAKYVP